MTQRPWFAIVTSLVLICMATTVFAEDADSLAMRGSRLTAKEAESLEKRIEKNPRDTTSRIKLLGYYFEKGFESQSAREAKCKHVLWFIRNIPESDILSSPYGELNPIVLQYFKLCSKFWEMGQDRLDQWTAIVEDGKIPRF